MFRRFKDRFMFKRRSVDDSIRQSEQRLSVEQESLNENLTALARLQVVDAFQRDLRDMFTGRKGEGNG